MSENQTKRNRLSLSDIEKIMTAPVPKNPAEKAKRVQDLLSIKDNVEARKRTAAESFKRYGEYATKIESELENLFK